MRFALIAVAVAVSLPMAVSATAADGRGCGRHAVAGGVGLHHAVLRANRACPDKNRISDRRARRAVHGGFFEIHGRYQH